MDSTVLIRVIIAHLITDFILQPKKWVNKKKENKFKAPSLYLHIFLTGFAAWIFIGDWNSFLFPVYIMITHLVIDVWKSYQEDKLVYFIADQLLHLIVLVSGWFIFIQRDFQAVSYIASLMENESILIIALGYIIVIWPLDYLIKLSTDSWRLEINSSENKKDGLKDAGKWIGKFERVLILTFILMNNLGAIGFLIAAKSVFRFGGEKRDRQEAEYILFGTLLSFTSAILTGALTTALL